MTTTELRDWRYMQRQGVVESGIHRGRVVCLEAVGYHSSRRTFESLSKVPASLTMHRAPGPSHGQMWLWLWLNPEFLMQTPAQHQSSTFHFFSVATFRPVSGGLGNRESY
jgi:hypothetical protein